MFNKSRKKVNKLIATISKSFEIDESTILYFIASDLERIIKNNLDIETERLNNIEDEIKKNREKFEKRIELEKEEYLLKEREINDEYKIEKEKIDSSFYELEKKSKNLNFKVKIKNDEIDELRKSIAISESKLAELRETSEQLQVTNSNLSKSVKKEKYDQMMKAHQVREDTDKEHKKLKIILAIFTVIGVAIAIAFIIFNKKTF